MFTLEAGTPNGTAAFEAFHHAWTTQIGDGFPLPAFTPASMDGFRVQGWAAKAGDAAIVETKTAATLRTDGRLDEEAEDRVRLFVVRRGAWSLGGGPERDELTVSAGRFLLRHIRKPSHFEAKPRTAAMVIVLPTAQLLPLLARRDITGPADSAELRLLTAHAGMVHATAGTLGGAGLQAAHNALVELAKAVAVSRFDDTEPGLAPALVQAVKDHADRLLAEPQLGLALLAREFHVSERTLQRAFAAAGESVSAYIRRRRLEEAGRALAAPAGVAGAAGTPSVSELAAYWQFADSSHFIRAFKRQFGQTPTEYGRRFRR